MNSRAWPVLSRSLYCTLGPTFFRSLAWSVLAAEPDALPSVALSCSLKEVFFATARASWLAAMFSTLKGRKPDHSTDQVSSPCLSSVLDPTVPSIWKALSAVPLIGKPVSLSLLPPSSKLDW